ncbi:MAG: C4-type zinc ribbon domain-containing protein [Bacteroidia bacterium]|nr:C4-type zinc ribbon domain-containing protein [Bacteroidia bacterium]MDW8133848.1 C4-type zinc ribbon domain-containing protein [Bacteroidia bacterium]
MMTIETTAVHDRLVELIQLQVLYNRMHALQQKKGDLPEQIEDFQDKATALNHSLQELSSQLRQLESDIRTLHVSNDSLRDHEIKLQKTLMAVRNEQEYYKIETELRETRLTIEKNLRDISRLQARVESLRHRQSEEQKRLEEIRRLIAEKEAQLAEIHRLTHQQEEELQERIKALSEHIQEMDVRLFRLFERRRRSLRGGQALVPVTVIDDKEGRVACGGCYTLLPRQLQWELMQRNKIFVCENCGRILVDHTLFEEVAVSMP